MTIHFYSQKSINKHECRAPQHNHTTTPAEKRDKMYPIQKADTDDDAIYFVSAQATS